MMMMMMMITGRRWFWELYSHCQFIYDRINKTTKTLFDLVKEFPSAKQSVVYKAIGDFAKECQPDLGLVEVGREG